MLVGMVVASPVRAESKTPLRVMTYNVNYANPDFDSALDAIAKADVDVVLLQEITSEWKRALEKRFEKQYPHQMFRIHTRAAGGLAVLSKHAITAEELFASPERGWFPAERLVLDSPLGAVQILHVHLRPAIDNGSWIKGFMTTPPMRRREIESYWKKIAGDLPTIVAGDFNEDPTGTAVAFLEKQGLTRATTTGPTTWHYVVWNAGKKNDLLKLDIDHVMVDKRLSAHDGEVLDAGASDHRPVIVTIEPSR
ncbi:MAG TPA: endonuclease/exonuclease/phosphatase family protein [Kofleriaceae bacterium]|nr:endonuclease/exonuclease/phosphatase family protein [Kofleriaceae bacterium]